MCFVCFSSLLGQFVCFVVLFVFLVNFLLFILSCQYQCKWLPRKIRLRNDLLCVQQDVKLTHDHDDGDDNDVV